MGTLWLEVDEDGRILRRSEEVAALLGSAEPPAEDLTRILELRTDIRAAIVRRAGAVRFGIGRGAGRLTFDAEIGTGGQGAHMVLRQVQALDGEHELGRLLVAHAERHTDAFVIMDADGVIVWCDAGFAHLVGYERGEILGRHIRLFRSARVQPREVDSYWRSLFATGVFSGGWTLRRSDGVDLPVHQSVSAIRDADHRTTHYVGVIRDVSREREMEHIRSIDTALGLLARIGGDQAHRLNNLAAEIVAVCEQAMLSDDPASAGNALDRVVRLASGLGELGKQMLALSAGKSPGAGPADMGRIARDLAMVLERAANEGGPPIVVNASAVGPWVDVAPDALVRACIHLALRSLDGVAPGSTIEVVASEDYEEGVLRIRYAPTATERDALRWLLPDGSVTGPLGNEFVTRAYGAGVALSMEEERGGNVAICVRARLADVVPTTEPVRAPTSGEKWQRLLVVEDNEPLRDLIVTAMESLFVEVVGVGDGEAALRLVESAEGRFDLVVLDLRIPTRNGMDVLNELHERWPGLRCIVASGAAPEGVAQCAMAAGARAVLQKPFKLAELRAVVRSVLDGAHW